MARHDYDYEEEPKKKTKYRNPDDMLKTVPGVDPNRYKRGIAGFAMGISSFIVSFILNIWVWFFSLGLAAGGLLLTIAQRKIKRTKISSSALIINIAGIIIFAALIALYFAGVLKI